MKAPKWFREELAQTGGLILEDAISEEAAADKLSGRIMDRDHPFARALITEYARKQVKNWLATHRRVSGASEDDYGQTDLFPEIPRKVEVAPGRFVAQGFMTRRDWSAAVRQAETKASNASGHAEAIKQTADKVMPLLTTDDQTTGEVWASLQHGRAIGGQ